MVFTAWPWLHFINQIINQIINPKSWQEVNIDNRKKNLMKVRSAKFENITFQFFGFSSLSKRHDLFANLYMIKKTVPIIDKDKIFID